MDRGAWWATVHGVHKKLDTTEQLTHTHTHTHMLIHWKIESLSLINQRIPMTPFGITRHSILGGNLQLNFPRLLLFTQMYS